MPKPKKASLPPIPQNLSLVGKQIAKYRKLRGLTQIEMAEQIGITRDVLASYEIGKAHLNEEMVIRLALFLKISTDELLGIKNQPQEEIPSLRIMKRVQKIEELAPNQQKAILKTLDDLIKANS